MHAILQVTEEIFMIHKPKIPLTEIRKTVLQNAVKYMQDLMEIFQDVVGKSAESIKEARITVTNSSPSSLAQQFYHYK